MLSDSCMIATFTGRIWSARKFDAAVTSEVATAKNAKNGAGRYNKILLPNDPLYKEIKSKLNETRHYHYSVTLPWTWKGGQLLSSAIFMDYTKTIANLIRDFDGMANKFCSEEYFTKAKERAALTLGDLYRESEYPSPGSLRKQFYAHVDTDPVPSSGDIRVDLPNDVVTDLKQQWVRKEQEIVKVATEHLWGKLHDMVEKFEERTNDPDKNFHATLTGNIKNFTDILDKLNIGEDRFLREIGTEVATLGKIDVKDLKEDPTKRSEANAESKSLLEKIKKQMEAFHA